ncbi:MAG: hypothetical protein ACK5HY_11210, partial [Parahaliea sp.]
MNAPIPSLLDCLLPRIESPAVRTAKPPHLTARAGVLALILLWLPLAVAAQSRPDFQPLGETDLASLTTEVEQAKELGDQDRSELQSQLGSASRLLEDTAKFKAATSEQEAIVSGAKKTIEGFRQQLTAAQASPPDPDQFIPRSADVAELESQLALVQTERKRLNERLEAVLNELEQRPGKRTQTQDRLAALQGELVGNRTALNMQPGTLQQSVVKALARARHQALLAENESLEAMLLSEPARADIATAERAWLSQALSDADLKLKALGQRVEAAQNSASVEKLQETAALQAQARDENAAVRALVEANRTLAEQLHTVGTQQEAARTRLRQTQEQLDSIEQGSSLMRRRLEVAGRKEVLVRVMFNSMDSLPDTARIGREIKARDDLIANTSIAFIDAEEELRQLGQRDKYLADLGIDSSAMNPSTQELVDKAFDQRRQLLENGLESLATLQRSLIDNNELARKLIKSTGDFQQFLIGNLLWVRNFAGAVCYFFFF